MGGAWTLGWCARMLALPSRGEFGPAGRGRRLRRFRWVSAVVRGCWGVG